MKALPYLIAIITLSGAVSGCSTVKVPDIDFLKLPEFREIVKNNQTNVPKVSDVPDTPANVRSDAGWDDDAAKLLALRDGFTVPDSNQDMRTEEQIEGEYARLKAKAQAYKLDDPQ